MAVKGSFAVTEYMYSEHNIITRLLSLPSHLQLTKRTMLRLLLLPIFFCLAVLVLAAGGCVVLGQANRKILKHNNPVAVKGLTNEGRQFSSSLQEMSRKTIHATQSNQSVVLFQFT